MFWLLYPSNLAALAADASASNMAGCWTPKLPNAQAALETFCAAKNRSQHAQHLKQYILTVLVTSPVLMTLGCHASQTRLASLVLQQTVRST
jgi:hypothetical protein